MRLGLHWMREHPDRRDMDHVRKMKYASYTLFEPAWSDRDFCNELLAAAPDDAIFLLRHHGRSEQKGEMYAEPKRMGLEHAEEWAKDTNRIHLPLERVYMCGINEPNTNHAQRATDEYETWRMRRMSELGLKAGTWCFGTGHPSTYDLKPENKPNWEWYVSSYLELKRGGHIGVVHEYGLPGTHMWGNNCNRLQYCPFEDLKFVIQESGVDGGTGAHPGQGWQSQAFNMSPSQYGNWLDTYFRVMAQDRRVHSVQVFTYDFAHPWSSFDLQERMRDEFERRWIGGVISPAADIDDAPEVPDTPIISFDPFQKALEWLKVREGGFQNNPRDPGNWTGGKPGVGELKGTKYGISAASYPHLDIADLTWEQASDIYRGDYWEPSGAARQPWPFALMLMDVAVLHGLGAASQWLSDYGPDAYAFAWRRQRVYTLSENVDIFGKGWTHRLDELMKEMDFSEVRS